MVTTDELIIIVGASLGGLIVFLIILAIVIYCVCGRRRRRSEKQRRFNHLPPPVHDSGGSKYSNYNDGSNPRQEVPFDPRLPKVGSTGVWMGTPSMYAPPPKAFHHDQQRRHVMPMQRASSEDRLTSPHMITQGGAMQIYHSQQLPSGYQDPYGHLPRSNSYLDLNPYTGFPSRGVPVLPGIRDSRAILVEYPDGTDYYYDPYRDLGGEEHRKRGKKVQRTHSDLTGTKRKKRARQRNENPYDNKGSSSEKDETDHGIRTSSVEVHQRQPYRESRNADNRKQTTQKKEDANEPEINNAELSQTDSAKLRAINERNKDADKPLVDKWRNSDELRLDLPKDSDDERSPEINYRQYDYGGRLDGRRSDPDDVYIPNRREPKHEGSKEVTAQTFVSVKVKPNEHEKETHTNPAFDNSEETGVVVRENTKQPVQRKESNADGKQVSAAFDFLNNYMSDDEGTDYVSSRPGSPVAL